MTEKVNIRVSKNALNIAVLAGWIRRYFRVFFWLRVFTAPTFLIGQQV
jgi:hypothetical protein